MVGDWGAEPSKKKDAESQQEVAQAMSQLAQNVAPAPQFVMNVGDNIYKDGLTGRNDPRFKQTFTDVYSNLPGLKGMPWYTVLGNHDYYGIVDAQVNRSEKTWKLPARYYTFSMPIGMPSPTTPTVQFFMLDTNPGILNHYQRTGHILEEVKSQNFTRQLEWLDQELTKSKADWKVLVGHHGLVTSCEENSFPELQKAIIPIMKKHHVNTWLSGHLHTQEYNVLQGIHILTSGAGSQLEDPLTKSSQEAIKHMGTDKTTLKASHHKKGFQLVTLTPTQMIVDFYSRKLKNLEQIVIDNPNKTVKVKNAGAKKLSQLRKQAAPKKGARQVRRIKKKSAKKSKAVKKTAKKSI